MSKQKLRKFALVASALVVFSAVAAPQLGQVIKVLGVGAAVKQFGPEMNRSFNRLTKHKDTDDNFTRVVPIITVGYKTEGAIGAAQIKGARVHVEKVKAVAQLATDLFGREVRIRALIPVSSDNIGKPEEIKPVDGVAVSGIVDLKL